MILNDKHLALTSENDIKIIVDLYLKKYKINYLTFIRLYEDKSHFCLSSHANWITHYYQNKYYELGLFRKDIAFYSDGYVLWGGLDKNPVFADAQNNFNIANGITLIENHSKYCDFLYLGTSIYNTNIINFYINNLDLLNFFSILFKEKAAFLIKQAERSKIYADFKKSPLDDYNFLLGKNSDEKVNLLRMLKRFPLIMDGKKLYLTQREIESINHLFNGLSAKEISKIMSLSHKTVEKHIQNVKDKLDCLKRSELIVKLKSTNISKIFD